MPIRVWDWLVDPFALMYAFFIVGILMHFFLRCGNAFRSSVNTYPTRRSYAYRNGDIFLVRSGLSGFLFSLWVFHPGLLSAGLIVVGIAPGIANYMTIPPTLGTAWLAGLGGDFLLDQTQVRLRSKYPNLPKLIGGGFPDYDPVVVKISLLSKTRRPMELPVALPPDDEPPTRGK